MSAILVLWDIDHTLIENHGVNKETYALAFKLLTGREAEHRARTDGRTEPEIMHDMLTRHEIVPTADHIAQMQEALESATLANAAALRERGHELPGARDVLAGREGGARVVAVATGSDSAEVLRAAGADVVLPDLRDTNAVAEAVTSLAS